jgi:hypothetical protein
MSGLAICTPVSSLHQVLSKLKSREYAHGALLLESNNIANIEY